MSCEVTDDADDEDDRLDRASFVLGSKYRVAVIETLLEGPTMPTRIAERRDVQRSHVSRALGELSERGIVESHGDGTRTKLYSLTERGRAVAELVREIQEERS